MAKIVAGVPIGIVVELPWLVPAASHLARIARALRRCTRSVHVGWIAMLRKGTNKMPYLLIDFLDGQYGARRLDSKADALAYRASGCTVVEVSENVYASWEAWIQQGEVFQMLWRTLDNAALEAHGEKEE